MKINIQGLYQGEQVEHKNYGAGRVVGQDRIDDHSASLYVKFASGVKKLHYPTAIKNELTFVKERSQEFAMVNLGSYEEEMSIFMNKLVNHKEYGVGKIIDYHKMDHESGIISVKFEEEIKRFHLLTAFKQDMTFVNDEDANWRVCDRLESYEAFLEYIKESEKRYNAVAEDLKLLLLEDLGLSENLQVAFDELPLEYALTIYLFFGLHGGRAQSYSEIAKILDVSIIHVNYYFTKGLLKLKRNKKIQKAMKLVSGAEKTSEVFEQ